MMPVTHSQITEQNNNSNNMRKRVYMPLDKH